MSVAQLTLHLFLQIAAILAVCQGVGWIGRRFGQPLVVAEMLAGVLLGPSLLGWQRDALGVGTLMNTRGLMELIILNIGLHRGVIRPALFTILVLMAVVTTLMTSPLFDLLAGKQIPVVAPAGEKDPFDIETLHPLH